MDKKELLFAREEGIGMTNNWPQGGSHLQADQDENQRPRFEMTAALLAPEPVRGCDQPQAKGQTDQPKQQMERTHECS
jgi:hypothetical protein